MLIMQIGASDGKTDVHRGVDEVYKLINSRVDNLGILLEPNPEAFDQLVINYNNCNGRVLLLNAGVLAENAYTDFYICQGEMTGASTCKEELVARNNYYNGKTKDAIKTKIWCYGINDLLKLFNLPDYLVIDAEGCDGDIMEAIDLVRYRIPKIRFEFSHIKMEQLGRVCLKLIRANYVLSHDKADIVAVAQNEC